MKKKRIIAFILAVAAVLIMSAAQAADPIRVTVTPLDYQTGKAVSKTYVENELFLLRVNIDIPRFADLSNMQLVIEVDGIEIDDQNVAMATGTYYITGVVTDQPAALTVKIKDMAYDNADTAEELYNAMQQDRTVSATYYFQGSTASDSNIIIPKTGDMSIIGPALCLAGLAVIALRKRR